MHFFVIVKFSNQSEFTLKKFRAYKYNKCNSTIDIVSKGSKLYIIIYPVTRHRLKLKWPKLHNDKAIN